MSSSNGRVEFCQYRTWGTVCNEGWGTVCSEEWDDNDARVVCGQLGYSNPEGIHTIYIPTVLKPSIIYNDSPDASAVGGFVTDEEIPIFVGQVDCSGAEMQLSECMNSTSTGTCSSAGVTCEKIQVRSIV